jgi:class 3 adenylate cyclase
MVKCPQCNEENPPKFRHCGYCGAPLVAISAPRPPREVRRTVTIVFCDLKDSTELAERLDPETLHEVKERYFVAMTAEITRHGGTIEKYIGDCDHGCVRPASAARRRRLARRARRPPACGRRSSASTST